MWIFSCDGDVLEGKRLWIPPGKEFLIGRTAAEEGQFVVSDKTISRKHLTVKVAEITASDCANASYRTQITIQDGCGDPKGTKIGTLLNGEQIRAKTVPLEQDENVVSLGKYKHHFRFTWIPTNFTFSLSTKEQKANPYPALYDRLSSLDVRVLVDYERKLTTHLVAKKRNTSKGLQALINGKYIVNDSFIEALVAATTTQAKGGPSPLELDFDANFPDPLKYLPPRGEEPTQRGADAYSPNSGRVEMFEGYTFVFYEKRQFETLLPPITEGRGKAFLREAIPDQTTVDEFVRYVKSVAGEKGLGEFEDGSEGKGVVVVKFNPSKGAGIEWFAEFSRQIAQVLDHRLIEQNEFLDAILGNDASVLRRPLLREDSGLIAPPPTAATVAESQSNQASASTAAPMAPPEPPKRGRRRPAKAFVGFEDEFSGPINSSMPEPESKQVDETAAAESQQSQGLFLTQDPNNILQVPRSPEPDRTSRKRALSPAFEEEDVMEEAAPRAAALKRRRLANEAEQNLRKGSTPPRRVSPAATPASAPVVKDEPAPKGKGKKVKKEKEVDLIEIRRQQREKDEAAARAERESLQEDFDGMDIEQIRKLAIIEEMPIRRPNPRVQRTERPEDSERWDERWNARANFKKFRRRAGVADARGLHRVIVPLEEAKKKDYGIGDTYWDDDSQHKKKGKGKGKETQDISQSDTQSRPRTGAAEAASRILASEAEEEYAGAGANDGSGSDLEIVTPAPKAKAGRSQKLVDKTSISQNLPTNKRAAATTLTKPAPAKMAKQAPVRKQPAPEPDSDDDSDEGLKFRFKKRA
ncbi:hypothetical protein ONS95_006189 [Cadophora gregata]|uniref:uncharacterized protein n=1 Tax=Cadophora gregata TaxID=51156 RepID=UPI0026DB21E2|nr:uncharacterized protein ONS95_006189 [Cadophora gregata]KAK0102578.1 hypothetical protein ONS95_006189 [Cadophora gregata]KAK0104231.1 hypothetical protein ONS96_005324 [Cadophora gregata f. sp. sojae]